MSAFDPKRTSMLPDLRFNSTKPIAVPKFFLGARACRLPALVRGKSASLPKGAATNREGGNGHPRDEAGLRRKLLRTIVGGRALWCCPDTRDIIALQHGER